MQNPWGRSNCQLRERVKEGTLRKDYIRVGVFWNMAILDSKVKVLLVPGEQWRTGAGARKKTVTKHLSRK